MMEAPITKNSVLIAKFPNTWFVLAIPRKAGMNSRKQDEIPIGMHSVTQTHTQEIIRIIDFQPSGVNPEGGVIREKIA